MKTYFKIFLLSLVIELGVSPIRMTGDLRHCAIIAFVLFAVFQYFVSYKNAGKAKPASLLVAALAGCAAVQLPLQVYCFSIAENISFILPDFFFHLLGIVTGYLFYKSNKIFRVAIAVFSLCCGVFLCTKGYHWWINLYEHGL
jgi:hypothetical protein